MHAFYNLAFKWRCEEKPAARHMKGGQRPGRPLIRHNPLLRGSAATSTVGSSGLFALGKTARCGSGRGSIRSSRAPRRVPPQHFAQGTIRGSRRVTLPNLSTTPESVPMRPGSDAKCDWHLRNQPPQDRPRGGSFRTWAAGLLRLVQLAAAARSRNSIPGLPKYNSGQSVAKRPHREPLSECLAPVHHRRDGQLPAVGGNGFEARHGRDYPGPAP